MFSWTHTDMSSSDRELFRELGLDHNISLENHKKHFLGRVDLGQSWVKIYARPAGCLFWSFEIYRSTDNKTIKMNTGSGALIDYWATVSMTAEDMIEFE